MVTLFLSKERRNASALAVGCVNSFVYRVKSEMIAKL